MKNNKGIASIVIILIVVGVLAAGGVYYFWSKNSQKDEAKSYIKVISPNGGEKLTVGKTYSIIWEAKKVDKVMIYLMQEGGSDVTEPIAEEIPASLGEYSWTIPGNNKDINLGGQFRIFISVNDNNGLTHDGSDNSFSIARIDETSNTSIPIDYVFLKSIPFNFSTTEFISVYSSCSSDSSNCEKRELMLVKNNTTDKSNISIGKINEVSLTGNSGGLFVPIAITKDNKKIILSAEMGSPGAGGGSTDYGFAIASIPVKESTDELTTKIIATRSAIFYDYSSKVVFVDEGNKMPHFWQPGPSNNGMIAYRDLAKDTYKVILEEEFTSYKIRKVDEKNNILEFEATKYTIPTGCSSGIENNEWANIPDCAVKITTIRTISLPI